MTQPSESSSLAKGVVTALIGVAAKVRQANGDGADRLVVAAVLEERPAEDALQADQREFRKKV